MLILAKRYERPGHPGFFLLVSMDIEFIASLPDIQSAISIGGDGATRVKFDIPESEIANAVKLVLLKGQAFKVSIETIKQEDWAVRIDD